MSTEEQKTELLADFQQYLQQQQPESFVAGEQPDLHTLLAELTGLKAEVKAESRQFKNTLDTLSSALDNAQESHQLLVTELRSAAERQVQEQADMQRAMLLEFVDLYDRLATAASVLESYQPVNRVFKHSQKKDLRFIDSFKQGQLMTLKRFEQLLCSYQVTAIDCIGKRFDPVSMTAVETDNDPELDNGIVLEELRKGFLYQGQVLRLAEVKVNKIG